MSEIIKAAHEMTDDELNALICVKSKAQGMTAEQFDRWDSYPGKIDHVSSDEKARIAMRLINLAFAGDRTDEHILEIRQAIESISDARVIAEKLIDEGNYAEFMPEDIQIPDDYDGIDAYVEAAQTEAAYNFVGEFADDDEILKLFK